MQDNYGGNLMVIKSFFLPKETLQGAEIPSHVLWDDISFSHIKVDFPSQIKIKEVFNVEKDCWKKEKIGIIVQKVEVNGYLGIIFESSILDTEEFDVWVDFSFFNDVQLIEKITRRLHLFRPQIIIDEVPETLEVDVEKGQPLKLIKLRNCGEGTAIVVIKTPKTSQVQRKLPKSIQEFRNDYHEALQNNLAVVKKDFPEQITEIDEYIDVIGKTIKRVRVGVKFFDRLEGILNKIFAIFEENAEFRTKFLAAVADAYSKSIQRISMFENLLTYLNSVISKRVVFLDPLWIIPVDTEPKNLALELIYTDLMIHNYKPVKLKFTKIVGNKSGDIPIYRLFDWG
jgi:hypothetical protein